MGDDDPPAPPGDQPIRRWLSPWPWGGSASGFSVGTIAAPLLAAASVTLTAQVLVDPEDFEHASVVLLALMGATVALLYCVQCSFHGQAWSFGVSEVALWRELVDEKEAADPTDSPLERILQWTHQRQNAEWRRKTKTLYDLGILFLLAALVLALVPKGAGSLRDLGAGRAIAICIALTGLIVELAWVARTRNERLLPWPLPRPPRRSEARLFPPPDLRRRLEDHSAPGYRAEAGEEQVWLSLAVWSADKSQRELALSALGLMLGYPDKEMPRPIPSSTLPCFSCGGWPVHRRRCTATG